MSEIVVSIIVPVYNVVHDIEDCLISIMNQTMSERIECIIVDDQSTDGSYEVVEKMLDGYCGATKFHLIRNKVNRGVSYSRNIGISKAAGEYILFVDGDDIIPPNALDILYKGFLGNDNFDIVSGMVMAFKDKEYYVHNNRWRIQRPQKMKCQEFVRGVLLGDICNAVWNKLFRANLIKEQRFVERILNEDSLFLYELSNKMDKSRAVVLVLPEDTYFYRNRMDSYCNKDWVTLTCNICDNLFYFYNNTKLYDKNMSKEIYHLYVKNLYNILNYFYGKNKTADKRFSKYICAWKSVPVVWILQEIKGKKMIVGLFMKYFPMLRLKWLNYRLYNKY